VKTIVLPNGDRGRAVGLQVHPFVLPEEVAKMQARGRLIDPKTLPYTLVVACDAEPAHRTLDHLRFVLASGTLLTLALGFTLIDQVIRISLRPIDELTRHMNERSEIQLDSALTVPGELPSELSGLARNFDSLLARVAATRQRERDFIRNAAHELRTPIAGLRATTELALSQPRKAATYAAHLTTCLKTAEDLGELVKRLSALAHIGRNSASPANLETMDCGEVLEDCLSPFRPIFESLGLKIFVGPGIPGLRATGDRTLTRIVINNLLDNAASYTPAGGSIRIRCERSDDRVWIAVSNTVEGFTENPERLFEPLFRREHPLPDSGSHLGIGLTLSLDAANAMGGTLQARKTDDGWIEFVFGLPSALP
jgi:two-component system heavy metal sensor histidine kinase CusS